MNIIFKGIRGYKEEGHIIYNVLTHDADFALELINYFLSFL